MSFHQSPATRICKFCEEEFIMANEKQIENLVGLLDGYAEKAVTT